MFVCAASIIYKTTFKLISAVTPTEENHYVFFMLFFTDTDVSQNSKGKQGTILFSSLYHFHKHSDIYLQFCIMFNTYKHLCVLGKQKYTIQCIHKQKAFVGANGSKKGGFREALLTQPLLFQFFNIPLKR